MERHGRLVRTTSGWKCFACGFKSPLDLQLAQVVHQSCSPQCLAGSPLDEMQQAASGTGSFAGPGHLESDDVIASSPIRYGHHEPDSLMRTFAGAQYSQGASSVAELWPARRLSNDMVATETLQGMASAISQHPYSFPQPPGRSEDGGSAAFKTGTQLDSDDVVYLRDLPEERERSQALDQQFSSRIERAMGVIKTFQCKICYEKWRSTATTQCRHFLCCAACCLRTSPTCAVCRHEVDRRFPVEFHSSKLLYGLDIPFPLKMTDEEDKLQEQLLVMGFPESRIRRAIHLIKIQNNSEALPDPNVVANFMLSNPYPVPSMEEMELLLNDPDVDKTVKSRLCDYLEAICKCAICRLNFPDMYLMPCGHLAMCRECFHKQPVSKICPDCKIPIENQMAVFPA